MEKKSIQKTEEVEIKLDPKIQELYARLEEERAENSRLQKELDAIHASEMWRAGAAVRSLRPENRRR